MKLEKYVSNLYRESLKDLNSYCDESDGNLSSGKLSIYRLLGAQGIKQFFLELELNSTRMFLILDLKKEDAFKAACELDAFFNRKTRSSSKVIEV